MIKRLLAPGVLLAITLLSGCDKPARPRAIHPVPASALVSKSAPGRFGGRLLLAAPIGPKSFNPLVASDSGSDAIVRLLFSSLVRLDVATQQLGPGLAETWAVEPDQKTWTFKLRAGLRWSDGQPLTAEDVAFTWNEIMYNPDFNRITYGLFQVGGRNFFVTNLDAMTVRVVTPGVYAPFLEFFGAVPVLPKHILSGPVQRKQFLTAYDIRWPPGRIVGCGPYRLKEYQPGKFTRLEANPEFWITDSGGRRLPYFDEVMVRICGNPGNEASFLIERKADVCETIRPERFDQVQSVAAKKKIELINLGIGEEREIFWFNQNTGTNAEGHPLVNPVKLAWFRNKKFRQAVSCAIDREGLVREVYRGRAQPAYTFISGENPRWNNPEVPRYGHDPDRARSLLAGIGLQMRPGETMLKDPNGNPVEVSFVSNIGNPLRERAAQWLVQDLKKVGISLVYLPIPFEVLRNKVNSTFDYECALMGLGGGGMDPTTQINVLRSREELHQWFPFQRSPSTEWEARIDALMEAQMNTLDYARRKKYFDEVQTILADELPMIYIISPIGYAAVQSRIGNLRCSALTPYHATWNIEELYFKE